MKKNFNFYRWFRRSCNTSNNLYEHLSKKTNVFISTDKRGLNILDKEIINLKLLILQN